MDDFVEYMKAPNGMTEIQWWDFIDDRFHSYLVEEDYAFEELMGNVSQILEELGEFAKVFITSGDLVHLQRMRDEIEDYLITDVEFPTPADVMNGHLRGRNGILIICDAWCLTDQMRHCLFQEAEILKCEAGLFEMVR